MHLRPENLSSKHQSRGGHNKIEYALSVDASKELSMVEDNEKDEQSCRYFIEVEKRAKALFWRMVITLYLGTKIAEAENEEFFVCDSMELSPESLDLGVSAAAFVEKLSK